MNIFCDGKNKVSEYLGHVVLSSSLCDSVAEVTYDRSTDTGQVMHHTLRPEEMIKANSEYIQKIRQHLEEDEAAREHREKRRRRVLVEQLRVHEAQEVTTSLLVLHTIYYIAHLVLTLSHWFTLFYLDFHQNNVSTKTYNR